MDSGGLDLRTLQDHLDKLPDMTVRLLVTGGRVARFVVDWPDGDLSDMGVADYGEVTFLTLSLPGRTVAGWLAGQSLDTSGAWPLPELAEQAQLYREPSRSMGNPWSWPRTRFEVHPRDGEPRVDVGGFLIERRGGRTFRDLASAASHYLYCDEQRWHTSQLPSIFGMIRVADRRGRISKVQLSATRVVIGIEGNTGGRVELASDTTNTAQAVSTSGDHVFELPEGMPETCLVLLTSGGDWIDYRWMGSRTGYPSDATYEPADLVTLVKTQILLGEGPVTEFKLMLPAKGPSKDPLLKTVAAFASGEGGTILVGVGEKGQANEGEIVGVTEPPRVRDALVDTIRRTIYPEPAFDVQIVDVDSVSLVIVTVKADGHIHGVNPDRLAFYVRRGASTFPAKYEEIKASFAAGGGRPAGLGPRHMTTASDRVEV
jgi:hypothetical protein